MESLTVSLHDTRNDERLSEAVSVVIQHARKLNELLRDGKIRELELALGTVNKASSKGIYRCMDLQFGKSK